MCDRSKCTFRKVVLLLFLAENRLKEEAPSLAWGSALHTLRRHSERGGAKVWGMDCHDMNMLRYQMGHFSSQNRATL